MRSYLNGKWSIAEKKYNLIGHVPGTVQQDLIDQKFLPHPYIGLNEDLFAGLEKKDWIYEKTFDFQDILVNQEIDLVFEGIDTLSDVYLNGVHIGSTQNMFMEYRFDVKNVIKKGKNSLKVEIRSPINIPRTFERKYGKLGKSGETARGYIRKAQYSYGWDWGARMATSGIWKPVYIETYKIARIHDSTAYLLSDGRIEMDGFVSSNRDPGNGEDLSVEVSVNDRKIGELPVSRMNINRMNNTNKYKFKGVTKIKNIKLWYPRGVGEQCLYDFSFVLKYKGNGVYFDEKRIGFRRIEIIQEKDAEGETFIFKVNGERIFAKGANWIPLDNVLTWAKDDDYEKLLKMAYDANMNMLRVWGGGIYERDIFYNLCDELGIMVWQDFMFACLEYPDHLPWFRKLAN